MKKLTAALIALVLLLDATIPCFAEGGFSFVRIPAASCATPPAPSPHQSHYQTRIGNDIPIKSETGKDGVTRLVYRENTPEAGNKGALVREVAINKATGQLEYVLEAAQGAGQKAKLVLFNNANVPSTLAGEAQGEGLTVVNFNNLKTKDKNDLISSIPVMDNRDSALVTAKLMSMQSAINRTAAIKELTAMGFTIDKTEKEKLMLTLGGMPLQVLGMGEGKDGKLVFKCAELVSKNNEKLATGQLVWLAGADSAFAKDVIASMSASDGAAISKLIESNKGCDIKVTGNTLTIIDADQKELGSFEITNEALNTAISNLKSKSEIEAQGGFTGMFAATKEAGSAAGQTLVGATGLNLFNKATDIIAGQFGVESDEDKEIASVLRADLADVSAVLNEGRSLITTLKADADKVKIDVKVFGQMLDSMGYKDETIEGALKSFANTSETDIKSLNIGMQSLAKLEKQIDNAISSGDFDKTEALLIEFEEKSQVFAEKASIIADKITTRAEGSKIILKQMATIMSDAVEAPAARIEILQTLRVMLGAGAITPQIYAPLKANIMRQLDGQNKEVAIAKSKEDWKDIKSCLTSMVREGGEVFEGAAKGDIIKAPTWRHAAGQMMFGFTWAGVAGDIRDSITNTLTVIKTGGKEGKLNLVTSLPIVGAVGKGFKVVKLIKAGDKAIDTTKAVVKGVNRITDASKTVRSTEKALVAVKATKLVKFAPALESGLTRKLQRAIIGSLKDGEVVAVRSRAYGANFLDGKSLADGRKYLAKPQGVKSYIDYDNGVREMKDGTKYLSDLDLGFLTKNGKVKAEKYSLELGEGINGDYGHVVVTHGDNFHGVLKGSEGALRVQANSDKEILYIFTNKGFVEAGKYNDMVGKYINR